MTLDENQKKNHFDSNLDSVRRNFIVDPSPFDGTQTLSEKEAGSWFKPHMQKPSLTQ
jgi:hypothetical protein